jgi:predicted ATPase/class 3 adenylate cyclase/regulation of enolase protein 1 (concanavalin A-like superfamily)
VRSSTESPVAAHANAEPGKNGLNGERKQATVLLADVKGSTALAERVDTETWVEIMNQVFQILGAEIVRYGGQIDQYRGDGLIAFFGVPAAHEDDPERAVRAALGMQDAIARFAAELAKARMPGGETGIELRLRVGLNTGEVIAARVGSQQHTEDTAMGRAIAIAARMESAAEPGTVLVTESTYHLTQTLFDWRPLGQIAVKGVSEPVTVYRPLAARAVPGKGRGPAELVSPLVGREAELRTMTRALERLQEGRGGIVTVVGEAGIGKSRLIAEIRESEIRKAENPEWVEGRCLSYKTDVAYGLWSDMLRSLLGLSGGAPVHAVCEALEHWVRTEYEQDFDQVYPFLGRLLAVPLDDRTEAMLHGLGAKGVRTGTFRAVETAIERAARARPLVVVCEDLHWADPTSLDLLKHLLALTDRLPLLVVCLLRPETQHRCWEIRETAARQYRHRHADLWLEPLPDGESEQLIGNLLFSASDRGARLATREDVELDRKLQARIIRHADGNPFYLEEIVRSLVESGAIACDLGTCRWDAADETSSDNGQGIAIPDTLQGVLAARIDRLPQETRRVLQRASVIGRVFSYPLLAAVTEDTTLAPGARRGERTFDEHLVTLLREQMIRERARPPERARFDDREYIFKHVLTQEAAYNSLLRPERRAIHARVAQALEQLYPERLDEQLGLLAHHWERAGKPERAIPYLLRAGEQARVAHTNEEAVVHLQKVLALLDDRPSHADQDQTGRWRLEALRSLGKAHESISQLDQAESCLRQAITLGHERGLEPRALVRLYAWLGETLFWEQRIDESIHIGQEGLALLGDDLESVEGVLMNQMLSIGLWAQGKWESADAITRHTATLLERLPFVEELRPAYRHVGLLYLVQKEREKANAWQQTFEERATAQHDTRSRMEASGLAGSLLEATGDLRAAIPHYEQERELALHIGDRRDMHFALLRAQVALWKLGDLESAYNQVPASLEMAQSLAGVATAKTSSYYVGGIVALARGERKQARDYLEQAVRRIPDPNAWFPYKLELFHALGRADLGLGKRTEAQHMFAQGLAALRPGPAARHSRELAELLSGLESSEPDADVFRALCRQLRSELPHMDGLPFRWWFLEPAQPSSIGPPILHEGFEAGASPDWTWHDPVGDCDFVVQDRGLELRAANGRDLWKLNLGAPRLLRPVAGQFVAQVVCARATDDIPAIGGLLIWIDQTHYLRLDRGLTGDRDITFLGCLGAQGDQVIGRGKLSDERARGVGVAQSPTWLRLEHSGNRVTALCSADGEQWFTVGHVPFAARGPVQVGVYASGDINRTVYPGAYPDGTAIRFESFELWIDARDSDRRAGDNLA